MNFKLEIIPAIPPDQRHKIQEVLKKLGYEVKGGGTKLAGLSACSISFCDQSNNTRLS